MKKYIISPVTTYNEDTMLFDTLLGIDGKNMPLHYTVHGKTETQSRERAVKLAEMLTNYRLSQNNTVHHN